MIDQQCQYQSGNQEELNPEGVVVVIISGFEFHVHQVNSRIWRHDKYQLHYSIIGRNVRRQQVQIPCGVYYGEKYLRLSRYAWKHIIGVIDWYNNWDEQTSLGIQITPAHLKSIKLPAHDLVFQILSNRIIMAKRWDKSPSKRNIFMIYCFYSTDYSPNRRVYFFIQSKNDVAEWHNWQ